MIPSLRLDAKKSNRIWYGGGKRYNWVEVDVSVERFIMLQDGKVLLMSDLDSAYVLTFDLKNLNHLLAVEKLDSHVLIRGTDKLDFASALCDFLKQFIISDPASDCYNDNFRIELGETVANITFEMREFKQIDKIREELAKVSLKHAFDLWFEANYKFEEL